MDKILMGYHNEQMTVVDSRFTHETVAQAAGEDATVGYFVVRPHTGKRTAAQNRLYWGWLTDCEKTAVNAHAGKTQVEWHEFFKGESLCRIFERDSQSYADTIETVRNVWRQGMKPEAEFLHKHIVQETSTTDASVEQFSEYLNFIERWAHSHGITLRTDPHLYREAMGV